MFSDRRFSPGLWGLPGIIRPCERARKPQKALWDEASAGYVSLEDDGTWANLPF